MLTEAHGDILAATTDFITIPVNTVGVLGAGLARQFRDQYPTFAQHYQRKCRTKELVVGEPNILGRFVLFPTKKHWRHPSKLWYIEDGLNFLADILSDAAPRTQIALPKLGCGLGGLHWGEVEPLIYSFAETLDKVGGDVVLYK